MSFPNEMDYKMWGPLMVIKEVIAAMRQPHSTQDNDKLRGIVHEAMLESRNEDREMAHKLLDMLNRDLYQKSAEIKKTASERDQLKSEYDKLNAEMEKLLRIQQYKEKHGERTELSSKQKVLLQKVSELKKANAGKQHGKEEAGKQDFRKVRSRSKPRHFDDGGKTAPNQSQEQVQQHSHGAINKYKHNHPATKWNNNVKQCNTGNSNNYPKKHLGFQHHGAFQKNKNQQFSPHHSTDNVTQQYQQGVAQNHSIQYHQQNLQKSIHYPQNNLQYQQIPQTYQPHYPNYQYNQLFQHNIQPQPNQPHPPNFQNERQPQQTFTNSLQQAQTGSTKAISQEPMGYSNFTRQPFQPREQFHQRGQFYQRGRHYGRGGHFQPREQMPTKVENSEVAELLNQFTPEDVNYLKDLLKQKKEQEVNKEGNQKSNAKTAFKKKSKKKDTKSELKREEERKQKPHNVDSGDDDDDEEEEEEEEENDDVSSSEDHNTTKEEEEEEEEEKEKEKEKNDDVSSSEDHNTTKEEDELDESKKWAQNAYEAQHKAMENKNEGEKYTQRVTTDPKELTATKEAKENEGAGVTEPNALDLRLVSGFDISKLEEGPALDKVLADMVLVAQDNNGLISHQPKSCKDIKEFKKKYSNAQALFARKQ